MNIDNKSSSVSCIWSDEILRAHNLFNQNGYAMFHNAISRAECIEYSKRIKEAKKKGQCGHDPQCPISSANYSLFDDLLLKIKPIIEGISGKTLYPTYSYARIYKPGELLKKHTDRPSCQISCTLTLSYKGDDIWPIFFTSRTGKDAEIIIPEGSLVAYMGIELPHWRKKYKQGKEQIQVFLHYVDALGEHKDYVFDGRGKLNV